MAPGLRPGEAVPGTASLSVPAGTSAYVHPASGTVAVLLTQVELGAPGIQELLEAFWTATVGLSTDS